MSASHRIVLLVVGFAIMLGFGWQYAGAQAEKLKAFHKWEYKRLGVAPSVTKDEMEELNQLGDDGWEVAASVSSSPGGGVIILKRPKQ